MFRGTTISLVCALALAALIGCGEKPPPPSAPLMGPPAADTVYVEISPAWTGFAAPQDVLTGREPFVYVADTGNDRIVMMDLAGRVVGYSATIKRPVAIAQDYRFNLLVAAELDTVIQGTQVTIPAIFKIDLVAANHRIASAPTFAVYTEPTRLNRRFTGVAALPDNSVLVARTGPLNTSPVDPDVAILQISPAGRLLSPVGSVGPVGNAIGSIGALTSIVAPKDSRNFFITQADSAQQFRVQSFSYFSGSEGDGWRAATPSATANGLIAVDRFTAPEDIAIDNFGNVYVVDAERDSVFKFNARGAVFAGQSFGGPSRFNNPRGVAHFDRTLYVADTDNNRVLRFRLTTDN